MSESSRNSKKLNTAGNGGVDWVVSVVSVALLAGFCVLFAVLQGKGVETLQNILNYFNDTFGGVFLYVCFGQLLLAVIIAVAPIGKIKLGEGPPKYSTLSWASMLLSACMGSTLLYWGMIEWAYYYRQPPFGAEVASAEAAEWIVSYSLFHWGPTCWAGFAVTAVIIAYFFYVKKVPAFGFSAACGQFRGGKRTAVGRAIDISAIIATCAGVAISVALGLPLITHGIEVVFRVGDGWSEYLIVVALWLIVITCMNVIGKGKGIHLLGKVSGALCVIFMVCVLLSGPTRFIFNNLTNSLGLMLQNFARMSFYTDPFVTNRFPQDWTMFYWEWIIILVPVMALFIAKISQGRTIRQVIIGCTCFGSAGCGLFMGVLGGYGLYGQVTGSMDTVAVLEQRGPYVAIMHQLSSLPCGKVVVFAFVVMCFIFLVTTCNSSASMIASVTTKQMAEELEPNSVRQVIWSILIVALPLVLLKLDALETIKLCCALGSPLLLWVIALMFVSFFRTVRSAGKEEKAEADQNEPP